MDELQHEFAAGIAGTATRDIEAALDRALKRAETHSAKMAALVTLREKALGTIERIMQGHERRLPAAVLDEVLSGIHSILHPAPKEALAKRASGDAEMTREQKVGAFIELADELKELVAKWHPLFRKLKAEDKLDRWHRAVSRDLAELARVADLTTGRARMDKARAQLVAMYDEARLDRAFPAAGEKALIPNFHAYR